MCGIVGGVSKADLVPMILEGLRRLEYRGYDSAGLAMLQQVPGQRQVWSACGAWAGWRN